MSEIAKLEALEILDSRGNPTLAVTAILSSCVKATLVNSYTDAYRVQIHRISGTSDTVVNVGQLQSDLDLLRNWNASSTTEFVANHA